MRRKNQIVFTKKAYNNNRDELYRAIGAQLSILMENQYVCKVYEDETDIVVIEFEHDEKRVSFGCDELVWVSQEELEALQSAELEQDNP